MKPLIVVLGVSGSGKTTIGGLLAGALSLPFADADDLHPEANVRKMAAGHPLDDNDRWPWLQRVGGVLSDADTADTGLVIACSALKRSYRDAILEVEPRARFVLLDGDRELLQKRLAQREGHFMPATLLDSQLATLEPLADGEPGVTVSIDQTPAQIVAETRAKLAPL
ncbi:gluconokinase [Leifsonia bigeumensis]|uniref:Gluconokinase n=1 Tax=Leifsonella bigeumensis TaxID=433643 RepID=A0ABP7FGN2_9MICO